MGALNSEHPLRRSNTMTNDLPPFSGLPPFTDVSAGKDVLAPARHVIGSRYVQSVKAYVLELTGLRKAIGPKDPSTKDIRTDRVFIKVDEDGLINRLVIK